MQADVSTLAPQADAPTAFSASDVHALRRLDMHTQMIATTNLNLTVDSVVGGSACGPMSHRSRRKRTLLQRSPPLPCAPCEGWICVNK